jgi:hypothetical protein
MSAYNRYSALLVSKHFTELCHHHPSDSTADRRLEEKFLAGQESLQDALVTSLRNDFFYEPHSTDEIIERNRQLVSLWDWISLLLCMGFHDERVVTEMSQARGLSRFALKPLDLQARRIAMKPWPFRGKSLRIVIEGRHLLKTFTEETAMRKALSAASPLTLEIELIRG